jgi:hypothetical protein
MYSAFVDVKMLQCDSSYVELRWLPHRGIGEPPFQEPVGTRKITWNNNKNYNNIITSRTLATPVSWDATRVCAATYS